MVNEGAFDPVWNLLQRGQLLFDFITDLRRRNDKLILHLADDGVWGDFSDNITNWRHTGKKDVEKNLTSLKLVTCSMGIFSSSSMA